jgi:glutamine---fructose-6-phosphate transaminase (isomerizing)
MQYEQSVANTLMFNEAAESSSAVERQLKANEGLINRLAMRLRGNPPSVIVTCARGSSDHAASYGKYLFETLLGVVTSSAAPSVSSVYGVTPKMEGALFIAISQSGKSPDLICQAQSAKDAGAMVVALVNTVDSPLAQLADTVIPLHAGPELSVAATKSYICSVTALMHLVACWGEDAELQEALSSLPTLLARAWEQDWTSAVESLSTSSNLFVLGRGYSFGVALEAALKFKETCGLHAEALSSAEVKHGPMAIINSGFPVLIFGQEDKSMSGVAKLAEDFLNRDANVMLAAEGQSVPGRLPVIAGVHAACAPLLLIQSFYRMVNELSLRRGFNPDIPPHLNKVTETL